MAKRKQQQIEKINSLPRSIGVKKLELKPIIESLEKLMKINLITIHESCDDYVFGHKTKSRIFWVLMTRVALFLTLIRFAATALIPKHSTRIALLDFTYMLGDPIMAASGIVCMLLAQLASVMTATYQEMTINFPILKIIHLIKYNLIEYPLNKDNYRRLLTKVNYLNIIYLGNYLLLLFLIILHLVFTSIMYSTNEKTIVTTISLIITNIFFLS